MGSTFQVGPICMRRPMRIRWTPPGRWSPSCPRSPPVSALKSWSFR